MGWLVYGSNEGEVKDETPITYSEVGILTQMFEAYDLKHYQFGRLAIW